MHFPITIQGKVIEKMTDEEFFEFCQENKNTHFERDANGQITIMSPTGFLTSDRNSEINYQLRNWNTKYQLGKVLESNAGFYLPNKAMRSPDAAWVSNEKWQKYSREELNKFPHMVPEFIVELKSPSDSIDVLKLKMIEWMENGCLLGWLIDVEAEEVHVFERLKNMNTLKGFDQEISGEPVLKAFSLNLRKLRL